MRSYIVRRIKAITVIDVVMLLAKVGLFTYIMMLLAQPVVFDYNYVP